MLFESYIDKWCMKRRRLELKNELDQSNLPMHNCLDFAKLALINTEINSKLPTKSKKTLKNN